MIAIGIYSVFLRIYTHFVVGGILLRLFPIAALIVSFFLSVVVFILCGVDKLCAVHSFRRIPEKVFFIISALGGAIGLCFGMIAFHHKTAHSSFRLCAVLFGLVWIVLITLLLLFSGGFLG